MTNASLKEQLQAFAVQLTETVRKSPTNKPKQPAKQRSSKPAVAKPKPKWLDQAQYGVELLRTYFPNCFKSGAEVRPLKKGIKQDLIKRLSEMANIVTEDKACMIRSLSYYVNTRLYHKNVTVGSVRLDLEGQPAGEITNEEAQYSKDRMQAKLHAKQSKTSSSKADAAHTEEIPA